jgi:hypothetical protein
MANHKSCSTPRQTYDLTGQAGLTRPGAGDVLFYRDVTLPAGRLNVEFVAFDAKSQLGSIQRMPLDVTQDGTQGPSRRRSHRPLHRLQAAGRTRHRVRVSDAGAAVRRPGGVAQPR